MKLNEKTIAVLKNFSLINQSIKITPGNTLATMHPQRVLFAKAEVEDKFENTFCIYELPQLLATLSMFENPDIEFRETDLVISSGKQKVVYRYCDESAIIAAPNKDLVLPDPEVNFELPEGVLASVIKATGVLQLPDIAIVGENGKLTIRAVKDVDPGSNTFDVELGETELTFKALFKPEYLSRLPNGSYKVEISSKKISRWIGENVYWVALEKDSAFQ